MEESPEKIKLKEDKRLITNLQACPTAFFQRGISFLLSQRSADPAHDFYYTAEGSDVVLTKNSGYVVTEPTFHLKMEEAQALFDDLWVAGFRPTEGYKGPEAFEAQGKHLEDMRQIAFKKLGMKDELK